MKKVVKEMRSRSSVVETDEMQVAMPEMEILITDTITIHEEKPHKNGHSLSPEASALATGESTAINVAILSEEGFEEIELTSPRKALEEAGIHVDIISPHKVKIKAWNKTDWGKEVLVDNNPRDTDPDKYDALILPGGVMNPDKLRQNKDAIQFLRKFISTGKPVAAICHGAQTLIETGMIAGKTMTSYPSLKTDLRNAGVNWVDKEMVHDGQFITSRKPADLNAFNAELLHSLPMQGRRAA